MIRRGITLLEVLVAIFVMAIGMLALLTLFPLGALSMRQALKDNRCQQAAVNATAVAIARDIRNDANVVNWMTNGLPPTNWPAGTSYDGPSNPVYVDPIGSWLGLGRLGGTGAIARTTPQSVGSVSTALRHFSLLDDMEFDPNGLPVTSSNVVQRSYRYTWTYLVRRPRAFDPSAVELTVVVSAGRPTVALADEPAYSATGTQGDTSVTITYPPLNNATDTAKPSIRSGAWVLDASPEQNPADILRHGPTRSYFYRVVSVTDAGNQKLTLELQTPLRAPLPPNPTQPPDPNNPPRGVIVLMTDVAEVFEKGTGWQP